MKTLEMGPIAIADDGAWRPQRWTIATVATIHLFVSAILLTASPKVMEPPQVQSVEIVTLPDGTSTVVSRVKDPIVPDPALPPRPVQTPSQNQAPNTPSTVQEQALTPNESVPAPVTLPSDATNKAQEAESLPPIQPTEPENQSDSEAAPIQFKPIPSPLPAPVTLRPTNRDILAAPTPDQITLANKRLKMQEAAKLDPLKSLSIPEAQSEEEEVADAPYRPAPIPSLSPAQAAVLKPAQAQILRPTQETSAPLNLPKSQIPLPKVQVPRVEAADLRISEPSQSADSAGGAAGGATGAGGPGQVGQTGGGGGAPAGVTSLGGGSFGGTAGSNSGSSSPAGGPGGSSGAGAAGANGPSGILPRRPGGAGVKQEFPTGEGDSLLARMARTSECAQINRPRDAKCPNWDPIDGRRSRNIPAIPVAVPKDALPGRFEPGANPLPLCKPGTPQAQHGLSCLPSNDGPGIPKQ